MKFTIQGGTARHGDPALCLSCRYATVVKGTAANHEIVRCGRVDERITFKVTSCTEYADRAHPSIYHLEDIAWVLRTDAKRGRIGFVRGRELKLADRLGLSED